MDSLTGQGETVLRELVRLAGDDHVVTGRQLLDQGFPEFVARVYQHRVGYPGRLLSRVFEILRDKGYIKIERANDGTYTILREP